MIGRIKLVNPPDAEMIRGEDGLFRSSTGADAPADASVKLVTGSLESSNVNTADAMVNMIELSRRFDLQSEGDAHRRRERRDGGAAAPWRRLIHPFLVTCNSGTHHESSFMGRQNRTRCAADAHVRDFSQPRQRQHDRLQERPRCVRGPAVSERASGRRLDLAGHGGADGLVARHGRPRRGDGKAVHARKHADHRQQPRRGGERPRLLPGAAAGRHDGLHARR